ncbi:PREDICTED: major royal jelly protein 3-like isoform X2 [Wasmannia auropunctata]|uniref:major royal jelly protein 3-like isoform X2 n=1 Tax=Wasmannia auropunctata TaxID=64793 RepID=UPI0005ED6B72|nr:PREDICTED: major royal jelly protein 3-like isoform X2 [Wasmannia auropunctata]
MGQFLFLLILSMATVSFGVEYKLEYAFDHINFEWQSQKQMEDAIRSGDYNISRCFLYDVDQANDGTTYVTIPRELGPGAPATLAKITDQTGPGGPLLLPFPNWDWHSSTKIVNAHSIKIICNHIFILDTGRIGPKEISTPKLLVFDLKTNSTSINYKELVYFIFFGWQIATNGTSAGSLISPVVYIPGQSVSGCSRFNERIVFIADREGSGLVIYNQATKSTCRIESKYMKPTHNNFIIKGQSFIYKAGINSMTIIGDGKYSYFNKKSIVL